MNIYIGHSTLKDWSLIFYGTTAPIDRNDPVSYRTTPTQSSLSSISVSSINNYSNLNKPTIKHNRKQQQQSVISPFGIVTPRKNSKKNNSGKNKNNRTTTVRPSISTVLFAKQKSTTLRPKQPQQNILGNRGDKYHTSNNNYNEKIGIKAPKQIKENLQTTQMTHVEFIDDSASTNMRKAKLLQQYQKIQQIFPELQPVLTSSNGGKPSRENSKIIYFPEPDFFSSSVSTKKSPSPSSSLSTSTSQIRTQNTRISPPQPNGKG